ncbi:MAG: hypothetical protein EZS28_008220 [Streblomastix strix]|uniref:Uncharacterized protein n=1 Tax=Streblomastix strix TaxID=222440 RepID=A0A5J4WN85_9EUKA|nr:MAG: hypothetical protein EZS28_008220 [Streblomastix strix]
MDSQRFHTQNSLRPQQGGQNIRFNKFLNILNSLESGVEEASREVLLHMISGELPPDSTISQKPNHNVTMEYTVALLFELLMSPSEIESEISLNLIKEGLKQRKDFRNAICGHNGILGRSANVISQPFNSIHSLLNLVDLLLEVAKSGIRNWNPVEADEIEKDKFRITIIICTDQCIEKRK